MNEKIPNSSRIGELWKKIKSLLSKKQDILTGNPRQLVGIGDDGKVKALSLKTVMDNGTVTANKLDAIITPGTYTVLDDEGTLGLAGSLYNLVVSNSAYVGVNESITQNLIRTYNPGMAYIPLHLYRSYYYANNPQWTEWIESVNSDQIKWFSNPNLLDNWYFVDPINQRGETEYTFPDVRAYGPDRWCGSYSTLELGEDHFCWISGKVARYKYLSQPMELPLRKDAVYTLSALCHVTELSGLVFFGISSLSGGVLVGHRVALSKSDGYKVFSATFTCQYDLNDATVMFYAGPSTDDYVTIDIKAAKLELGPVQTLAHKEGDTWVLNDPPPNKALELAKCQRYQIPINGYARYKAAQILDNEILFFIPTPVTLRLSVTLTNTDKMAVYGQTGFTFAYSSRASNGAMISAKKENHGLSDAILYISSDILDATPPMLDANL